MSASPTRRTPLDFGVARVLTCVRCGTMSFTANEVDRAERMEEFHDTFCGHATLAEP